MGIHARDCTFWLMAGEEAGDDTKEGRSERHRGRSKRRRVGKAGTLVWLGHAGESPGMAVFRVRAEGFRVWLGPW